MRFLRLPQTPLLPALPGWILAEAKNHPEIPVFTIPGGT
jgi:hypothetical protein